MFFGWFGFGVVQFGLEGRVMVQFGPLASLNNSQEPLSEKKRIIRIESEFGFQEEGSVVAGNFLGAPWKRI